MAYKALIQAYKDTFDTPSGKIVLADLIKRGRIMSPFAMHNTTTRDLDFCEGQRQFVLAILKLVNYDFNQLQEHMQNYSTEIKYD